ncbi:MAG: sensor histidine kinase [Candidatus Obscuribacterales bacterium]|nr:sensor histidine kinase [Candidatus Obscuribacterales bacterium]
MNLKLPKLKIRDQLLILIVAPLIFQIGISLFLYQEVSKVNNNLADLVYRRRILAVLDDLQRVHIESAYTSFFYSITKRPELSERYNSTMQQVFQKKQALTELTRNHPEYARDTELLLRRIDQCNHGVYLLMRKDAVSYFNTDLNPILKAQIYASINQWLNPMGTCFEKLRTEPVTQESFVGNSAKIRKLISIFFACCVALTGVTALWGSRVLIFRLSKIYAHVNQVKAGKKPQSPLAGEDELSELDQAIVLSAEKLLSLRSFKEDLIGAVSHDLRAPLTSIGGILTLARNGAYGEISDRARELLAQPVARCKTLGALVNDVLDLERAKAGKFNLFFQKYTLAELIELLQEKPQLNKCSLHFSNDDLDLEFGGDLEASARIIASLADPEKSSIALTADKHEQIAVTIAPALDREGGYNASVRFSLAAILADFCGITVSVETEQTTLIFPKTTPAAIAHSNKISAPDSPDEPSHSEFSVKRSRIAEAGLALIIVPAIICCTMLWMLSQMIDRSQNEIQREYRSYQILQCLNSIHSGHMYSGICTMMFNLTKSAEFAERRIQYVGVTDASLSKLESIFQKSSDQEERETLRRLKKQMKDIQITEQEFLNSESNQLKDRFNALPSIEKGLPEEMYFYRTRLVREREKLLLDDRSSELRDRKKAISILLLGILLVTVSTVLANRLLSKLLTLHLYNAIGNAKRLNSAEPLQAPTKGSDEIAVLDKYIYDSALELRQLENQRLELLSLLREELKKPILEASADIARVLEVSEQPLPDKAATNIRNAVSELSRLGALVDDLTNIEMLDKNALQLNMSEFSVNEVFAATITALQLLADIKSIKLICEPSDLKAHGDRERVLQIMVNLVSNAIKFSPNGSQVTLSANRVNRGVRINVKDEGPGISESDQAKIFQKFEQATGKASERVDSGSEPTGSTTAPIAGAGLGLHICTMLVEAHGGTIGVVSASGKGATFSVTLPDQSV